MLVKQKSVVVGPSYYITNTLQHLLKVYIVPKIISEVSEKEKEEDRWHRL